MRKSTNVYVFSHVRCSGIRGASFSTVTREESPLALGAPWIMKIIRDLQENSRRNASFKPRFSKISRRNASFKPSFSIHGPAECNGAGECLWEGAGMTCGYIVGRRRVCFLSARSAITGTRRHPSEQRSYSQRNVSLKFMTGGEPYTVRSRTAGGITF